MNLTISKINNYNYFAFKNNPKQQTESPQKPIKSETIPVYGNDVIRTKPAQLSLFHMHDFHGQNIRMESAYNISEQYDNNLLKNQNKMFSKELPVDKLKLCSGDMFLGENLDEISVVNEFLNMTGVLANTIGNHECDADFNSFVDRVKTRKYRFLSANLHPKSGNKMNEIISNSFIAEVNGNKYGVIGLTPLDIKVHLKRAEDIESLNVSDFDETVKCLQEDIDLLKKAGVNKIILLSHLGLPDEQKIAQSVNDIDVILGGHTHNLLTKVEEGTNLFTSPKGEPVLIMQVGRDGEYVGLPNIKFNELGQMTEIQYNYAKISDFSRNMVAKKDFERFLGTPEIVGKIGYVEAPPKDIYAMENPHCNFIADCMRKELGTDIAIMNSANIRRPFNKGIIDTRDLHLATPFGNKMAIIEANEKEIVKGIQDCLDVSMANPKHRPGILQVSGLTYTYSASTGKLKSLSFIDKNNNVHPIDIENPRTDKLYTIALDDFCAVKESNGIGLKHRYDNALAIYDKDKDAFVADYLRKQKEPVEIKSDGRIKIVD